jgi:hypothetical protein
MNYSCLIVKVRKTPSVDRLLEIRKINVPSNFRNFYCVTNKVYSDEEIEEIRNDTYAERQKKLAINRFAHSYIDYKSSDQFKADNKIDALNNILKARNFVAIKNKWILVQNSSQKNRQVYAFQLSKEVLSENNFVNANPNYKEGKLLLYIGETSKTIEERFLQHIDENHQLAAQFMQSYGLKDFIKANWTPNILKVTKINPEKKNAFNSKYFERKIALKLREFGYGVWFN